MSAADKKKYFQSASLWVGNDAEVATNNTLCQGSPFLDITDLTNYSTDTYNGGNYQPWNYGKEAFCNLEGRYLHLVATPADLTGSFT